MATEPAELTPRAKRAVLAWLDLDDSQRAEMMDSDHGEEWPLPIAQSFMAFDVLTDSEWAVVSSYLRGVT